MRTNRVPGDTHLSAVLTPGMVLNPGPGSHRGTPPADWLVVPRWWKGGKIYLPPCPCDGDTFQIFDEFDQVHRHGVVIDGAGFEVTDGHTSGEKFTWGHGHHEHRHQNGHGYDDDKCCDYDSDYDSDYDYDYDRDGCNCKHEHSECGNHGCHNQTKHEHHWHRKHGHSIKLFFTLHTGHHKEHDDKHRDDHCRREKDCHSGRWFVEIIGRHGESGEKGCHGQRGCDGDRGPRGEDGKRGKLGATGPSGPPGPTGTFGGQLNVANVSGNYQVLPENNTIVVTTIPPGGITVALPATPVDGEIHIIADGSGTNGIPDFITINGNAISITIPGNGTVPTVDVSHTYGSIILMYSAAVNLWLVVGLA